MAVEILQIQQAKTNIDFRSCRVIYVKSLKFGLDYIDCIRAVTVTLLAHITILYKRAGIKGSSHSGRRGFAGKVLTATGDMDTVAVLLGHSSIDCSQRYIDVSQDTLCEMFSNAL